MPIDPVPSVLTQRLKLLKTVFPSGVPQLWCPPLTHYKEDGSIDKHRIAAHLQHLSTHVKGFLIPGSTGDGWELTDAETKGILELALDLALKFQFHLLIGALKSTPAEVLAFINHAVRRIQARTGQQDPHKALAQARVSGFAVCAPHGEKKSQSEIAEAFSSVLELGFPVALYQLPQITKNEFSPEVAASLAAKFPNLLLLKDSSWADRVVLSGEKLDGVFTMRGAEGDYARWLKLAGGPYDGLLLSTANCFAGELSRMVADLAGKRMESAEEISKRLTAVINETFELVKALPDGNAFANANKAMDHFFAHGPGAADVAPPRLHSGNRLPLEIIRQTGEILRNHKLMPAKGYLE